MLVCIPNKFACVSCVSQNDFVYNSVYPTRFFVYPLCIPRTVVPATVHKAPKFEGAEIFHTLNIPCRNFPHPKSPPPPRCVNFPLNMVQAVVSRVDMWPEGRSWGL